MEERDNMIQAIKNYAEQTGIDISNIHNVVPPMLDNIYSLVESPFGKTKSPDVIKAMKEKIESMLCVDSDDKYLEYVSTQTQLVEKVINGILPPINGNKRRSTFDNTTEWIKKYSNITPADKLKYLMDTAIKLNVKEDLGAIHDRLSDLMDTRLPFFSLCYALVVDLFEHDPDHYQVCNCVKQKYSIIIFSNDLQEIDQKISQGNI